MKQVFLLVGFTLSVALSFAQNNKVISASNYLKYYRADKANSAEDLLKAKENIDAAAVNVKTANLPKTHNYLGQVYQELYYAEGEQFESFKNGETLKTSVKGFDFAMANADKRTNVDEVKRYQGANADEAFRMGISYYQNEDFAKASEMFQIRERVLRETFERIDTISIFNVGLCAEQTGDLDLALQQYRKCADMGYNGGGIYANMASILNKQEKTDEALAVLTEGREKYPDEVSLLVEQTNIFLKQDRIDEALENLNTAIEKQPDNDSYYFARGNMYDKKGDAEKAIADYKMAIENKAENSSANYNIGAISVTQTLGLVE